MIQGTNSSAGKTLVAAALCRIFHRRGHTVAPFKPQNMALNSAVTADGGEIGRAQALQAAACGIQPITDMNPVLLKPCTDTGAQVIVQGKVWQQMDARAFHTAKPQLMPFILESFARLSGQYERIIIEGAGSPAEINLRQGDLANMGFAEAVDCPVLIVGDIDRGGVFAHLAGTFTMLSPSEQNRVKGFVINKFRGDASLLTAAIEWLEKHTGKPVLGVIPYIEGIDLEAEDSVGRLQKRQRGRLAQQSAKESRKLRVMVPATPRMSNDTDFQSLMSHDAVEFSYVQECAAIPSADLVVLPGSKSVAGDLRWLRANGWSDYLLRHLRYGGKVIGICGGFQILGRQLADPEALESSDGEVAGLGLFDMKTELKAEKKLARVRGRLNLPGQPEVAGYEIHMGVSSGSALDNPAVHLKNNRSDGAISRDNQILGTYIHGIFDRASSLSALLAWAGVGAPACEDLEAVRDKAIDRVADVVESSLRMDLVDGLFR